VLRLKRRKAWGSRGFASAPPGGGFLGSMIAGSRFGRAHPLKRRKACTNRVAVCRANGCAEGLPASRLNATDSVDRFHPDSAWRGCKGFHP